MSSIENLIRKSIDIQTAATFARPVTLVMGPDIYAKLTAESRNLAHTIDGRPWIFGTRIKIVHDYPKGYLCAES